MMVIGITGGIGSGKTTVSKYLRQKGLMVIDADIISRDIVKPGEKVNRKIREIFGNDIFLEDGNIDRKKLGDLVFSDGKMLLKLNEITHSEIINRIKIKIQESKNNKLIFIDAALLFETGLDKYTDEIWMIDVPEEIRIDRVHKRDGLDKNQIKSIISKQISREELKEKATVIIDNTKGVEELIKQIDWELSKYEI